MGLKMEEFDRLFAESPNVRVYDPQNPDFGEEGRDYISGSLDCLCVEVPALGSRIIGKVYWSSGWNGIAYLRIELAA